MPVAAFKPVVEPSLTRHSSSQIRVLVVDDSIFDRKRLERSFARVEPLIKMYSVADLEALQSVVEVEEFDVVFIDHILSGHTGFDAIDLITRSPRNAHAKLVMIAGQEDAQVAADALAIGCVDYIPKSDFSTERLWSAIRLAMCDLAVAPKQAAELSKASSRGNRKIPNDPKLLPFNPQFGSNHHALNQPGQ